LLSGILLGTEERFCSDEDIPLVDFSLVCIRFPDQRRGFLLTVVPSTNSNDFASGWGAHITACEQRVRNKRTAILTRDCLEKIPLGTKERDLRAETFSPSSCNSSPSTLGHATSVFKEHSYNKSLHSLSRKGKLIKDSEWD